MDQKLFAAQVAKVLVLLLFLLTTPLFISTPMRQSHLYLFLNLLIIVLAVDSGALHADPREKRNLPATPAPAAPASITTKSDNSVGQKEKDQAKQVVFPAPEEVHRTRRQHCPPTPTLFFIGEGFDGAAAGGGKEVVVVVRKECEAAEEASADELFARAETFIGNFYRQLKTQKSREESSWNQIHGLYHTHPF